MAKRKHRAWNEHRRQHKSARVLAVGEARDTQKSAETNEVNYTMGLASGWNRAMDIMEHFYQPLMDDYTEMEHVLGHIDGIVISHPHSLPWEVLETYAIKLGDCLNRVDMRDKKFRAFVRQWWPLEGAIIDISTAIDYRLALVDRDADNLRSLVGDKPLKKENMNIMLALRSRDRGHDWHISWLHQRASDYIKEGMTKTEAVRRANRDLSKEHSVKLKDSTARNYFYQGQQRKGNL